MRMCAEGGGDRSNIMERAQPGIHPGAKYCTLRCHRALEALTATKVEVSIRSNPAGLGSPNAWCEVKSRFDLIWSSRVKDYMWSK